MTRYLLGGAAVLALVSCGSTTERADPDGTEAPGAQPSVAADFAEGKASEELVSTLAGGWRIAGIDGEDFNETYGLALYATGELIYWEPSCAGQERLYTIDGARFEASVVPVDGPRIVCDIGVPVRLADVWRAFDNARAIEKTQEGGVRIAGGGYSVTLFRQ